MLNPKFQMTLIMTEEGQGIAVHPDLPGQHFPIEMEPDVLERLTTMLEEVTMECPECHGTGSDGWSFCPTCQGSGHLPNGNRHAKRCCPSHNPQRAAAVPSRKGKYKDPPHRNGLN